MSYLYQNVARAVALRAKQLKGGDYAARDSAYLAATIEPSLDGTEVTYGMLKHSILATAKEIAAMVGNSTDALFRATLASRSLNLVDKAQIPLTDQNGSQFIGAIDGYFDATTNESLTEQPIQQVMRRIENAGDFHKIPAYSFAYDGTILRHTRTNVYARGCSWDAGGQESAFDADPTTPPVVTFSDADINLGNDTITEAGHGLYTGFKLLLTKVGATLPIGTGIVNGATLFAIVNSINTLRLATTLTNALTNIAIDITNAGSGSHTLTPVGASGGGLCPLPQELEVLHICKTLAFLPEEDWFVPMASYYRELVEQKEADIIEGRMRLMSLPQLPVNSASVDPNKD